MNIKDALIQLDTANDEHWTSEGLPVIEVVKELLGRAVTRAEITSAAKGFTRKNPSFVPPEVVSKPEPLKGNENVDTESPNPQMEAPGKPQVEVELETATKSALLDNEQQILAEYNLAVQNFNEAKRRLDKAMDAKDKLVLELEETNKRDPAEDIKRYQASQARQRAAQAGINKALHVAMKANRTKF